jgi:hypothetical protein
MRTLAICSPLQELENWKAIYEQQYGLDKAVMYQKQLKVRAYW